MVTSGWQNAVKFTHVISKGSRQQLVLCNVAAFFYSKSTRREIGDSKCTPRKLGHSKGTGALEH